MADKHQSENGDQKEFLHRLRHSASHVMAEAVLQLYPDAKIAIGPAIDTGFYYDFDLGKDANGRVMAQIAGRMSESEMRAVADYAAGLH